MFGGHFSLIAGPTRMGVLAAALGILLAWPLVAWAQTVTPGAFTYRWNRPVPPDAIANTDIPQALVWTRHLPATAERGNDAVKAAIANWLKAAGRPAAETLTRAQAVELVSEGLRERDAAGWGTMVDDAVGFSIGLPTRLVNQPKTERKDGVLYYQAGGTAVSLTVSVQADKEGCGGLDRWYSALVKLDGETRRVTYQDRKDDWFVLAGETGTRRFFTRARCAQNGIVTAMMTIDGGQYDRYSQLFAALSRSLAVRPSLDPQAEPSVRLRVPAAAPAPVEKPTAPPSTTAAPPTTAPTTPQATHQAPPQATPTTTPAQVDRTGRTASLRLVRSDGNELKPREVFERVSGAVYVVRTPEKQGSAVAISDRELLTNCHVLDRHLTVTLEQEGRRQPGRLVAADGDSDKCVLAAGQPLRSWVRGRPFADVKVGEPAYTVGAPRGFELTIAEGIVSSKRTRDGTKLLQTSAPISNGSSGGGLFDAQGNLLGITTWMRRDSQNLNFAISAEDYAR